MSVCPVPASKTITDYSAPGSITFSPPDAKYEFCIGGTTSVITPPGDIITQTVCCPNPGPPGPAGSTGCSLKWQGAWSSGSSYNYNSGPTNDCFTSIVSHNGVVYIAKTAHTASSSNEPGVGGSWTTDWDVFATDAENRLKWAGDWVASTAYKKNDVVRNATNGNAYVCQEDHTSSASDEPGETTGGDYYWDAATDVSKGGMTTEEQSIFDTLQETVGNVFDWIENATVGDWIQALAVGTGIIVAGAAIVDMMTEDGTGDGNADSRFNGTTAYSGAITPTYLPTVIASLMEFCGYTSAQYDVSMLPNTAVAFTVNGSTSIRDVISNMSLIYQFDVVPSGGVVKFIPKYQGVVKALTSDDLGHGVLEDGTVGGSAAPYTAKRLQGIELPRSIVLTYYSKDIDYNIFTQSASLETYTSGQDVKIEVPFSLTDAEAKRIVETALVNSHLEQQEFVFITDYNNIELEPGDIITMPLDSGSTAQLRIVEVNERDDGLLEYRTTRSDYNTTSYVASGVDPVAPPTQTNTVPTIGYSQTLFVEVPPISSSDITPRLVMITHGYNKSGWPGAAVYQSVDGGVSYNQSHVSSKSPTFGSVALATPAPTDYHVWDTTTTITVVVKQGTLISKSELAVMNGENWCMIGTEVIGFANATLTAPNTYQLSKLLRGRAGTEVNIGDHQTNELFFIIDDQLTYWNYPNTDIGKPTKFKTITVGSDLSKVSAVDVQPYALNARPWAVAQPKAVKSGSDWVISWIERPRGDNQMRDYTEISHDPDFGGFAIAIFDSLDNIVRTITTVSNTTTYTAAQQTTDFGSVQPTLKASIVQMSTIVGGGYPSIINA